MHTKTCCDCEQTLPVFEFHVSRTKKARGKEDIWYPRCKRCHRKQQREYHAQRKNDPRYKALRRQAYTKSNRKRTKAKQSYEREIRVRSQRRLIELHKDEYLRLLIEEKEAVGLGHTNTFTQATLVRIAQAEYAVPCPVCKAPTGEPCVNAVDQKRPRYAEGFKPQPQPKRPTTMKTRHAGRRKGQDCATCGAKGDSRCMNKAEVRKWKAPRVKPLPLPPRPNKHPHPERLKASSRKVQRHA